MDELSQIDLVFCVDLTRSMEPFIDAARRHVVVILGGLRADARADLRVAVVGYRDHDPDPRYEPVEVYPFTADDAGIHRTLAALQVGSAASNTDAAEAVLAGLAATMKDLEWRPRAFRVVVLIGDAPPHACGADASPWPDRFPQQDPSGYSVASLSSAFETAGLFLHALGMVPSNLQVHDPFLEAAFSRMARMTGGTYRAAANADAAIAVVEAIGRAVFGQMELDRQLFAALAAKVPAARPQQPGAFNAHSTYAGVAAAAPARAGAPPAPAAYGPPPAAAAFAAPEAELAAEVGASAEEVNASMARLRKRGLLPGNE